MIDHREGVSIKRILFIADANSIHTARFANALVDRGIKVKVISLRPLHGQKYHNSITHHGVPLDRAPTRSEMIRFIIIANVIALLWRPCFVHAHYCSSYGVYSRKILFFPRIISVWGSDILVRAKQSQAVRKKIIKAFKSSRVILGTSQLLVEEAAAITTKPVFRTPFGVDTKLFSPEGEKYQPIERLREANPGMFVIGCVKWLNNIYGIDTLIDAFKLLVESNPRRKFLLVLTGEGPDGHSLKQKISTLGLQDSVLFTGALDHNTIPKLNRSLDIAAYPSRSESFGVSILESSACGLPVIGTHEGGIPEVISNGSTGRLVRSNNPRDLAVALADYSKDPDLCKNHGGNGRLFVEQNYDWQSSVSKLLFIYDLTKKRRVFPHFVDIHPNMPRLTPFSIFHYPFRLEPQSQAARPIRVRSMKEKMAEMHEVVEVMGSDKEKKRAFALVKYYNVLGRDLKYLYAETHSTPTITFPEILRRNSTDYKIFAWLRKKRVPSGVFLRDFYAFDKSLRSVIGVRRYYSMQIRQFFDLSAYRKYFDIVFVPCEPFAARIAPYLKGKSTIPLPPATDNIPVQRSVRRKDDVLRLVYIGGLGYHYDMRKIFAAVSLLRGEVELDVICRPRDLTAVRSKIGSYIRSPNIRILHKDQNYFFKNADNWDLSILVRQPHSYIEMAYPVKLFDYVRANLPVLVSNGQYCASIVKENGLGPSVNNNVNDIIRVLRHLNNNRDDIEVYRPNLLNFAIENTWAARMSQCLYSLEVADKEN